MYRTLWTGVACCKDRRSSGSSGFGFDACGSGVEARMRAFTGFPLCEMRMTGRGG
jgi:hypothetical protein